MRNDMDEKRTDISVLKIVIGVLVTSGLVAIWIVEYASPIIKADSELAKINAEIALSRAELQESLNKVQQQKLEKAIAELRIEKDRLTQQVRLITDREKNLIKQYEEEQNKSKELLAKYNSLLDETQKEDESENKSERVQVAQSLVNSIKENIAERDTERKNYQAELEERFNRLHNIEDQITELSLSGIWESRSSSIEGSTVYIEFLPNNKIRTYWKDEAVVFSNQDWAVKDNYLLIKTEYDGEITTEKGILKGNEIQFATIEEDRIFYRGRYIKISNELEEKLRKNIPKKTWFQQVFGL